MTAAKLLPCPFHNAPAGQCACYDYLDMPDKEWNKRPREDNLRAMVAKLEIKLSKKEERFGYVKKLEQQVKELQELVESDEWISIHDRLPEKETTEHWEVYQCVIDWFGEIHVVALEYICGEWYLDRSNWTKRVLAWREMPKVNYGNFLEKNKQKERNDIIATNS